MICDCRCTDITSSTIGYVGAYDLSNFTVQHDLYNFNWTSDNSSCPVYYKIFNQTSFNEASLDYFFNQNNDSLILDTSQSDLQAQAYNFTIRGYVHPDKFDTTYISFTVTDHCSNVTINATSISDAIYDTSTPPYA